VKLDALKDIYFKHEIPSQADMLAVHQRRRAMQAVQHVNHDGMQALFTFLAATLLD